MIIRLHGCYPTLLVFVSWLGLWETDHQRKRSTISPDSWLTMLFLLQVRLLTGIARFNEMSYIFDTLFEHEHFELLCRRGIDKVTLFYLNWTVAVHKRPKENDWNFLTVLSQTDLTNKVIALSGGIAAILNSVVSNSCYGRHTNLPPAHPTIAIWNNRIPNDCRNAKKIDLLVI